MRVMLRPSPSSAACRNRSCTTTPNWLLPASLGMARGNARRCSQACNPTTCSGTDLAAPPKGNDKGNVEGMVGYVRRNFMVPEPRFESFEALNAHLADRCLQRQSSVLRGHTQTIAERFTGDLACLSCIAQTSLRGVRDPEHTGEFTVYGALPEQRLLGAGGLWAP